MDVQLVCGLLFICLSSVHGARILGIFPTPLFSHQQPFQVIMKALAKRGHQVTVLSPFPLEAPVDNYTDIDLSFSKTLWKNSVDTSTMDVIDPIDTMHTFCLALHVIIDDQLTSPQVQSLIRSNDTRYDLVIFEKIMFQSYYGLIHRLGSPPVIGINSFGGLSVTFDAFGNPTNPSYIPHFLSESTDHMTFWERTYNVYVTLRLRYLWSYMVLPIQETIMRKHFGSAAPSVYEAEYNDSLLLLNNHWSMDYPKPLLPNIVELTGLHLQRTAKPLPKDMSNFLDGAKHGVVYFSLGSTVMTNTISEAILRHILDAFSLLPQRVLMKWVTDTTPEIPSNVMLSSWLPQQDVLAHPNVRVFITQGGLQSFQEASYHGVPLIVIPFIGDQRRNMLKVEAAKIGVGLMMKNLTKETLLHAVRRVLNDTSYQDNMNEFSAMYREHVGPSLDRAMWWIEYVIRHNGTRHLRSAALDLAWYQYLLLDVIAAFLIGIVMFLVISYLALKKIIFFTQKLFVGFKLKKA